MNKKIKKTISFLASISFLVIVFSCGTKQQKGDRLFDAERLIGSPDTLAVKQMMNAEPDTSYYRWYFGKLRFIQLYASADSSEFRFKDGKLIEVVVNYPTLPFKPASITQFGLPFKVPSSQDSSAFFMWKNQYKGFETINFYLVGNAPKGLQHRYKIYFKLASDQEIADK